MDSMLMQAVVREEAEMRSIMVTRKLPVQVGVTSPLIEFLEKMGARERLGVTGIRPSWKLGYLTTLRFENGESLLSWLKPFEFSVAKAIWPSEACRVKAFKGPVKRADFVECCEGVCQEVRGDRI